MFEFLNLVLHVIFKVFLNFDLKIFLSLTLIYKDTKDKKDVSVPTQQPKPSSTNSSNRNGRRSSSTNQATHHVSVSSTNSPSSTVTSKNYRAKEELDENSRNHAPPQYSDAVRLPNINPTSQSNSSPMALNSTTEQTGIL